MGTEHHTIMEVKKFVDDQSREVNQFTQVFGKDKDESFYKGKAMVRVQPMNQQGMPMPPQIIPFEFCFPEGITLKKAFDTFDEVCKKEIDEQAKEMKERAAASKVVPASSMPTLLGANGKRL
jgi:hypothetical protein